MGLAHTIGRASIRANCSRLGRILVVLQLAAALTFAPAYSQDTSTETASEGSDFKTFVCTELANKGENFTPIEEQFTPDQAYAFAATFEDCDGSSGVTAVLADEHQDKDGDLLGDFNNSGVEDQAYVLIEAGEHEPIEITALDLVFEGGLTDEEVAEAKAQADEVEAYTAKLQAYLEELLAGK